MPIFRPLTPLVLGGGGGGGGWTEGRTKDVTPFLL